MSCIATSIEDIIYYLFTGAVTEPNPSRSQLRDLLDGLVNGNMILAQFIWSCVITILLIPLVIIVLVQVCKQRKIKEDYTNNLNDLYKLIDEQSPSPSPRLHRNIHPDDIFNDSIASSTAPSVSHT